MGCKAAESFVPPEVTLSAGKTADMEVAQGMGCEVINVGGNVPFELRVPDGITLPEHHIGPTELAVWTGCCPPFSTDVSAAIEALTCFRTPYRIIGDSQSTCCELTIRDREGNAHDVYGYADGSGPENIALAISLALIRCFRMKQSAEVDDIDTPG